jgi:hypothetical protein
MKIKGVFKKKFVAEKNLSTLWEIYGPALKKEKSSDMKTNGLLISLNACKIHSVKT